ncbi:MULTISPECIES: NADP-dependent oxidoreductase [unclassified Nostoc]|uniref:quinone oxidoreductase family protein n=1 Tax=unclassified Nostoc TaxID=2593658 RepID=UPI002AD2F5F0|nr:NADP-dependent oxidoreductase [Nostoc sp. DedQUE03]MDZ7976312.1 NADP-dependent oxidoreductase [Nostoc sp. DedQUE03]MDZ8047926.1 NADP-dependent oxidoreductase [Nostoc sp. DedQUE02]
MQNTPQQMKAMAVDEFGHADKLTLHTLPVPMVDAGEVLIRIEIAGVGIWDAMEREGDLVYNEVHFPRVLGGECAGTIVAIGDGVERFAVGDRVYAQSFMNDKGGSYAQYVVVSEKTVASIPDGLDMLMAGGLPIAGITALNNLLALGIGSETKLMLWGASGGVGHVALQLAKRMGALVFAIASGADGVELCKQLGADEAVDGRADDVAQRARAFAPDGFDAALVLVGGDTVQSTLSLVRQGGIVSFPNGVMPEPKAPDGVELKKANGFADPMLLDELNRLIGIGEFQVHIAQTFALSEAAQAQDAMKQHYLGKIVLRVSGE